MRISALDAHALAISSTAICSISVPVPVPPYSSANGSAEDVVLGEQLADVPRVLARARRSRPRAARPAPARSGGSCRGSRRCSCGIVVDVGVDVVCMSIGMVLRAAGYPDRHGNRNIIFLIAVGAILKFAVTDAVSGVELATVGVILMVVGVSAC